jgi:hypothetical protein
MRLICREEGIAIVPENWQDHAYIVKVLLMGDETADGFTLGFSMEDKSEFPDYPMKYSYESGVKQ